MKCSNTSCPGTVHQLKSVPNVFYAKIQLLISGGIGCGVFIHSVDLAESSKNACFPLQKALKEKEEHIEQLLKERDMERSEVVRAAAQVDEVRFGRKYKS